MVFNNLSESLIIESLVVHRVEKLNLRRRDSRWKLAGITFCCAGAILITFYRGPPVLGWFNLGAVGPDASRFNLLEIDDWKVGAACLIGSGLCIAVFINLQVLIASWDTAFTVIFVCCIILCTFILARIFWIVEVKIIQSLRFL